MKKKGNELNHLKHTVSDFLSPDGSGVPGRVGSPGDVPTRHGETPTDDSHRQAQSNQQLHVSINSTYKFLDSK